MFSRLSAVWVFVRNDLDFFDIGDGDRSILFDNATIWVCLGLCDGFLHDACTFNNNLALLCIDSENGSLFAFVVTGDDFDFVTFTYVCLGHGKI